MQQINLYSEILKQQQKQSGIKLTTVFFAAAGLISLSFSGYLLVNVSTIEAQLHQAQTTLNQEQDRVNVMLAKRPSQTPNASVLAEIEQWQNSVNDAAQTLQMLVGREAILSQGFSIYLEALANQSNRDIWLSAIHIDRENSGLSIEGSTFKPEQIPQALQQLQQESVFKGQTFAKLSMKQSAKIAGQMDFTLSSSEQPLSVKDHAQ